MINSAFDPLGIDARAGMTVPSQFSLLAIVNG
jgi:hypothetical protein